MCQQELADDALTREQFAIKMARALVDCRDLGNPVERLTAYCRAGYQNEQIIAHDEDCKNREIIRRSIGNLRQKAAVG